MHLWRKLRREDLYYRLNVVTINAPALRERMADLALLFDHFLGTIRREGGVNSQRQAGSYRSSPGSSSLSWFNSSDD